MSWLLVIFPYLYRPLLIKSNWAALFVYISPLAWGITEIWMSASHRITAGNDEIYCPNAPYLLFYRKLLIQSTVSTISICVQSVFFFRYMRKINYNELPRICKVVYSNYKKASAFFGLLVGSSQSSFIFTCSFIADEQIWLNMQIEVYFI